MMTISEIQLFQILKSKIGDKGAEELVMFVKLRIKAEIDIREEMYAIKSDIAFVREDVMEMKSELIKSIYFIGLIQFLAITGAMIGVVNFMIK